MNVLAIEHQHDAGPGVFAQALTEKGARLTIWQPASEPVPSLDGVDAAVVLGGAANVHERDQHPWLAADERVVGELLERRVPTLGVCLGAQLVAAVAGGSVRRVSTPEIGWYDVELEPEAAGDPILGPLPERFSSFQWHSYEAVPPPGAVVLARSAHSLQAFRLDGPAWGIQFHAEVSPNDAAYWITHYHTDPDAVSMGIVPEALQASTDAAMEAWNETGRALCARFLDAAYSEAT